MAKTKNGLSREVDIMVTTALVVALLFQLAELVRPLIADAPFRLMPNPFPLTADGS